MKLLHLQNATRQQVAAQRMQYSEKHITPGVHKFTNKKANLIADIVASRANVLESELREYYNVRK